MKINFKYLATYTIVSGIICLSLWSCSNYEKNSLSPKKKDVSVPLNSSGIAITSYSQHVSFFGQGQTPPTEYVPKHSGGIFSLATLYLHTTVDGIPMEIYVFPDQDSRDQAAQDATCDKLYECIEFEDRPAKEACYWEGNTCKVVHNDNGTRTIIICTIP